MGVVHWHQGRIEDALNSLTRALEIDPTDRGTILNCHMVFTALGRPGDAKDILVAYQTRFPEDCEVKALLQETEDTVCGFEESHVAEFFNKQGERQFELGRLDRARACFEMAVEAVGDHADAISNLGVVMLHEGDTEGALEEFYRALELNPDSPDILRNCFEALKAIGELDSAIGLMQILLRKGFGEDADWDEYSSLIRQARASDWSADGLSSEVAEIYLQMGRDLFNAGDVVGAATALERSLKINGRNEEALNELSRVRGGMGDDCAARAILNEGLALLPDHPALMRQAVELKG
jgi:tetratricopeptide (TPR) repeat protein